MRISRGLRAVLACGGVACVGLPHIGASASTGEPQNLTSNNTEIRAVSCVSASFCEAVGWQQDNTTGFFTTLAEVWNGKNWSPQATPNPAGPGFIPLLGVSCLSATFCEAVGDAQHHAAATTQTLAEVWNGVSWAIQPTPNAAGTSNDDLFGVSCHSVTFCEAVGSAGNGSSQTLAEVWDGSAWTIQPTANPSGQGGFQLLGVSCASMSFCEAVGQAATPGNAALGEVWNGISWVLQSLSNPPGATGSVDLQGVSCISASDCEAVGLFYNGTYVTLAEAWDGTSWAVQASPNVAGAANSQLYGVSCVSASDCEAVGFVGSTGVTMAALWDGTSWTLQPIANPKSVSSLQLFGVSCVTAGDCEAGGDGQKYLSDPRGIARTVALMEGWNGTTWTAQ